MGKGTSLAGAIGVTLLLPLRWRCSVRLRTQDKNQTRCFVAYPGSGNALQETLHHSGKPLLDAQER